MTDHIEEAIERLKQLRKVGFGYDIKDGDRAAIDVVIGALAEKDKRIAELERERDDATGTIRYCEEQWSDERGVMIDKFVYERNRAEAAEARAEAAERQLSEIAGHMDSECDSDSILHGIREAEADRTIYKDRATSAESEAARLRALLAEAREVVDAMKSGTLSTHSVGEECVASLSFPRTADMSAFTNARRAARALAEKLEKEIGNG